jgi:hypothetical protein
MAKTKKETENVELEVTIEEVPSVVEVQPEVQAQLLRGYIRVIKKGGAGNGIVINARNYGEDKTYKPSIWELVDSKKK